MSLTNLPGFEFHSFPSPAALGLSLSCIQSWLSVPSPPRPPCCLSGPWRPFITNRDLLFSPLLVFKTTVFTHGFYLCTFLGALSCWKTLLRTKFGEKSVWISKVGLNTPRICNRPSRSLIVRGSECQAFAICKSSIQHYPGKAYQYVQPASFT